MQGTSGSEAAELNWGGEPGEADGSVMSGITDEGDGCRKERGGFENFWSFIVHFRLRWTMNANFADRARRLSEFNICT